MINPASNTNTLDVPAVSLMVGNYISLVSELPDCGGHPGPHAEFAATELFAEELKELNSLAKPESPHSVYELEGPWLISEFTLAATVTTLHYPPSEALSKLEELIEDTRSRMRDSIDEARRKAA